ncbi:MAG: D-glycero-beta-D-manno-heptose 1,7-bisphosphate 7-phosphatase [Nanoarchaeota archaeon]|nr:D-glycero-beta-D-manno-heptose 1,7-bisphosphate 7-phosphatase [Nanoarchaeota archaeon]
MDKAIFIDRDGVINKDLGGYISRPEDFKFIEGVIEALKNLNQMEFKLIVITNQGGIAKGEYTEQDLESVHKKMVSLLENEGIRLTGIYYCPHHTSDNCDCRKPRTGMIEKAVKEHNIDPKKSFFIGDKTTDIQAGKDMGCMTFLVKTGYGGRDKICNVEPDFIVEDFFEASKRILEM